MPQALPANPFSVQQHIASNAFDRCVELERKESSAMSGRVIAARMLGHLLYLLNERGKDTGRDELAIEINECEDEDALLLLGNLYREHFVQVFRRASGSTPQPSNHPSVPDVDVERDSYMKMAVEASLDHGKAKAFALKRDGFACIFSSAPDISSVEQHPELLPSTAYPTYTEAAHIIPESINHISGKSEGSTTHHRAGNIRRIFSMFGAPTIPDDLNGNFIHRLENILTLTMAIHRSFDELELWLEPVEGYDHKCYIRSNKAVYRTGLPETIEFKHSGSLPPPDRRYIELHALACKVAHLSGAAEYISTVERELDETRVLSGDGSSAELLTMALSLVSPVS